VSVFLQTIQQFFRTIALHQSTGFNIFVTAPFGLDGSGQCMDANSVELYRELSRTTSGIFFNLCQSFTTGSVQNVGCI
jgi:hypothetical protein